MKKIVAALFFAISSVCVFSQEALKSIEEEYYDFLSLMGIVERPSLNYRTLSDSVWRIGQGEDGEQIQHVWQGNNLGRTFTLLDTESEKTNWYLKGIKRGIFLKAYGPEWFNSFNTAAPYGQNDGALWQGKGYNTSLTAGVRLEGYGLEMTLKPQLSFSQNMEFAYIKPNYAAVDKDGNPTKYIDKASVYGYYGVASIDAPQRFGDKPFFTFDWGDTEIRYSWHTFTVGFGTQSIWLGPAQLNPIIHSNNAASYPKFDIGMRRQRIVIPKVNWYLGDLELRCWWGKLSESKYFDNDSSNDDNLISGIAVAWSLPWIFKGLTIGFNRTLLAKWNDIDAYSLFRIYVPNMRGGGDETDQRFSLTFDYQLPIAGLEIYLEWARNDFSPNMDYIMRYPFHTQGWTFGAQKAFDFKKNYGLKILLELTFLECSADYDRLINWYSTFYAHHIITQGYTNKGQWLGAGIGTGGNSQYLGFEFYHPKGKATLFFQRCNPDLDYTMYIDSKKPENAEGLKNSNFLAEANIRCNISIGLESIYFITNSFSLTGGYVFTIEKNPLNKANSDKSSEHRFNSTIQLGLKYNL